MTSPACRVTDYHSCPLINAGPTPHVGGAIASGSSNVLIGGLPAARVSDTAACAGAVDMVASGSSCVLVNSLFAVRIGDFSAHGGIMMTGCQTVFISPCRGVLIDPSSGVGATSVSIGSGLSSQAKALLSAARNNTPFCEICEADGNS